MKKENSILDFFDDADGNPPDLAALALSEPLTLPEESTLTLLRLLRSEWRCRASAYARGFTREEFALAWPPQLTLSMFDDTRTTARSLSAHIHASDIRVLVLSDN